MRCLKLGCYTSKPITIHFRILIFRIDHAQIVNIFIFHVKFTSLLRRSFHLTPKRQFQCGLCQYTSSKKSNLGRHMLVHTGEKAFKFLPHVRQGNESFMLRTKLYKCDLCPYASYKKSNLQNHSVTHTGVKAYQCIVCGKSFSLKGTLKRHQITHNVDFKNFLL
ncbi:hypothetical protein NPIL_118951 [Nephila pilipes]|uniref:Protein hunchback n=1 Tax=Nephila pilipes TaxID=299642 RepID=A0A8X6TD33_NEPPI|nr:hypothetical protein NPIL_118951 [Nephila pilipes]